MASADAEKLARLRAAYLHFKYGKYASAIEQLDALPDGGGELGRCLHRASTALLVEAAEPDRAMAQMEEAFALGQAAPVVLTEAARFFKRHGRHALANAALAARELVAPDRLERFVDDVPVAERARYAPWVLNASPWVERQSFYSTIRFKAAFRERYGPEAAALLLAEMGPQGGRYAVTQRPIVSLRELALARGIDYVELIPKRTLPPARIDVYGTDDDIEFGPLDRALFTCVLEDVIVSGKSNFLLAAEGAVLDFQADELARRPQDLSLDPTIAWNDDTSVLVLEPQQPDGLREVPEAIWLAGTHSRAFGHWLMEFLPKLWALLSRPGFERVPILVDAAMPPQHVEALRFFTSGAQPLVVLDRADKVRVARLWVSSQLQYMAMGALPRTGPRLNQGFDQAGFRDLVDRVQDRLETIDTSGAASRVYLARTPYQHRKMSNAAEVEALMQRHGFERYEFSQLGFVEQLRIVRGAELVVGPAGSAMYTSIFGRRGLDVGVLAGRGHPDSHWLAQANHALGNRLTVVFGERGSPNPNHRSKADYAIDLARLAGYLEDHGVPAVAAH